MLKSRKRSGRITVGLLNPSNHCFVNSDLQAFAALPELYTYLTELLYSIPGGDVAPDLVPLSLALRQLMLQLNEPTTEPKSVSPWPFLSVLESIYSSRLSRSQHDAHELLHLLIETLEMEHSRLVKKLQLPCDLSDIGDSGDSGDKSQVAPDFPFSGATTDTLVCKRCGTSTEKVTSFLVLSLMVPQARRTSLPEMLHAQSSPEEICGYGCVNCRVSAVLNAPEGVDHTTDRLRTELKPFEGKLQDLPLELESQLPTSVTSVIEKSTRITRLPAILAIHLSRSIYSQSMASRNPCKVELPEYLDLDGTACGLDRKLRDVTRKYRLYAVIRHSGTHYMGHYECSRRKDKFWDTIQNTSPVLTANSIGSRSPLSAASTQRSFSSVSRDPSLRSKPTSLNGLDRDLDAGSIASTKSVKSISSDGYRPSAETSPSANTSQLPFPTPPRPQATVLSTEALPDKTASSRSSHASSRRSEPAFWTISDTSITETTTRQLLAQESAAYIVFYQRVNDRLHNFPPAPDPSSSQ